MTNGDRVIQLLSDGVENFSTSKHWCRWLAKRPGIFGRRYCAVGFIQRNPRECWPTALELLQQASWDLFRRTPITVNDHNGRKGYKLVHQIYRRALELAIAKYR